MALHGSDHNTSSEGRPRALSCERPDRIILSNALISLAFATTNGTLVSLYHPDSQTELIDPAEAGAEGFLWRLDVGTPDDSLAAITSREATEFVFSLGSEGTRGEARLALEWRGFRVAGTAIEGKASARILLPPDSPLALFEFEIELPERVAVLSVSFPCLCALGSPGHAAGDSLFLPLSGGMLIRNPHLALHSPQKTCCQAIYPGSASLQMLGYRGGRVTTWLASQDQSAAKKTMTASAMAHSNRLALWIEQHCSPDERSWHLDHPVALGLVQGDWFDAARQYRAWATQQAWCGRGSRRERALPTLTSSYGLWLSYWGGPRGSAAAARELQRLINTPIKLDWRCWHKCARGGAYPDYFPPREGEQGFALAKQQLSEAGVLTQLNLSGLFASPEAETWEGEGADRYALAAPTSGDGSRELVRMCPSTPYWRSKLGVLARQAVQLGADGIYLEDLIGSLPLVCERAEHEHGAGSAGQWTNSVRAELKAVRDAVGEAIHLSTDGPGEPYLDIVDAFFSPHPAAEREGLLPTHLEHHCTPIPLFSSVYHDYSTLIGPPLSLVNQRPHDPLWPAGVVADLRLPAYLMERDFGPQFCLEVARAICWGHHLLLASFSPDQARREDVRRKLAFLAAGLRAQAWGVGALLPYAEFMGPLEVDSPILDLAFLVNPCDATPSDRRSLHVNTHPILGSAWRTPGGGLSLVFVNAHQQLLEFSAHLPSSRLLLEPPLHLVGRTFSEDGDAPAASLLVSGTEISGRLPGRCVLLVTLR